jgi:hypothetical protein
LAHLVVDRGLRHGRVGTDSFLSLVLPQPLVESFKPILEVLECSDPTLMVRQLGVLERRWAVMSDEDGDGDWRNLSTEFSLLHDICSKDPKALAKSMTEPERRFVAGLTEGLLANDSLECREKTSLLYGKHWSALSNNVTDCVTADPSLAERVIHVVEVSWDPRTTLAYY